MAGRIGSSRRSRQSGSSARHPTRPCCSIPKAITSATTFPTSTDQRSRECAVRARVRVGLEEHAFRRGRRLVGAEAHPLDRDLAPNVVLRGDEVARADAALVFDDEIYRRLLGGSATDLCYVGERLSGERLECVALEGNEQDPVGAAGGDVEILPVPSRRAHLVLDALGQGRFPKASEPRAKTAC